MKQYFVVHRYRQYIEIPYVRKFMRDNKDMKYHTSLKTALKELHNGFYDDSDYGVFSMDSKGKIKRYDGR